MALPADPARGPVVGVAVLSGGRVAAAVQGSGASESVPRVVHGTVQPLAKDRNVRRRKALPACVAVWRVQRREAVAGPISRIIHA